MERKLNCILLIDDDQPTNFFNELVIKEANCAEKVVTFQTGAAALEFLCTKKEGTYPQPDLILLDINMPAMNGWEFLTEYEQLSSEQRGNIVIIMLTTSLNPDDVDKAKEFSDISDFKNKPLAADVLQEILEKYFMAVELK